MWIVLCACNWIVWTSFSFFTNLRILFLDLIKLASSFNDQTSRSIVGLVVHYHRSAVNLWERPSLVCTQLCPSSTTHTPGKCLHSQTGLHWIHPSVQGISEHTHIFHGFDSMISPFFAAIVQSKWLFWPAMWCVCVWVIQEWPLRRFWCSKSLSLIFNIVEPHRTHNQPLINFCGHTFFGLKSLNLEMVRRQKWSFFFFFWYANSNFSVMQISTKVRLRNARPPFVEVISKSPPIGQFVISDLQGD